MKMSTLLASAVLLLSPNLKAEEFEVVKVTPAKLSCDYAPEGKKAVPKKVAIEECWVDAKEVKTKKVHALFLSIAHCQGKKGDILQLDVVKHVCKEGENPKLKCALMPDRKTFAVERLIDQSFETKICNSGHKEAWLEKSLAGRSEVKY